MDRKKLLIPVGVGILAVLLIFLLLPGNEQRPPAETAPTRPAVQDQTPATEPGQTTGPAETQPETTEPPLTDPVETGSEPTVPEETEPKATEPKPVQTEPPAVTEPDLFPLELEDGKLIVRSLFQFTGMNPDFENYFGEDIAGVQMINTSDEHMTVAEVTAVLTDGTTLTFRAEDIPAGGSVMAFCLEHASVADVSRCEEIFGYAEFESGDMMLTDQIRVDISGTEITLRNVSGEDLTNLEVTCHGLLDGSLFGGTTYHYNVSTLPAGSSAVVHAVDCILGMTEVVRVELGG